MKLVGVALVVLASSCISPVMRFGGGKTAKQSQHDIATKMTPPALDVDEQWEGAVQVAKIRVWADDDYRAQNVHWQQSFQERLDYANKFLSSQFGVRLEAEYRAWNHHSPETTLADSLAVLAQEDPGDDVLTVVGLTSSQSLASATFEQIGYASIPGRHLILRGYADLEERKMFERAFHDLSAAERASLYQARRRHKTAALLLHELGHNFGAEHQAESETLMNASYANHSTSFDPTSRAVILATLDRRLHRARKPESRPSVPVAQPTRDSHPTLVIVLDPSGQKLIGGNAVDDSTLDGLFRLSFEDDADTAIVIKASRATPQRAVNQVLDRAKAAGLHRVSMVVDDGS